MAISGLSISQYVDGSSKIYAADLNAIVSKINELVVAANSSSPGDGPAPTPPSAPTITINSITATISAEDDATIKYTIDGSTPSATAGITYSGTIVLSSSCTIKAVAIKDGVASTVASQSFDAILYNDTITAVGTNKSQETAQVIAITPVPGSKIKVTLGDTVQPDEQDSDDIARIFVNTRNSSNTTAQNVSIQPHSNQVITFTENDVTCKVLFYLAVRGKSVAGGNYSAAVKVEVIE